MNWVSVNDRLPEDWKEVLTFDVDGYYKINYALRSQKDGGHIWGMSHEPERVTHWIELPEQPKEKDEPIRKAYNYI